MAKLLIALWVSLGLFAFNHAASETLNSFRSPNRILGVGSDRGEKTSAESSNVHKIVKQKKSGSNSDSKRKKLKATSSSALSKGKGKGGSKSSKVWKASKGKGGSKSKKSSKGLGSSTNSSLSSKGKSTRGTKESSPSFPSSPSKGLSKKPSMESESSKDESPPTSMKTPESAPSPMDTSEPAPAPAPVAEATGAPVVSPVSGGEMEPTQAPVGGEVEPPSEEPTIAKTEAPTEQPATSVTDAPTEAPDEGSKNGEVFSIGNIRPEGITAGDGSELFFTNLLFGGVRRLDLSTNEITEVVPNVGYFDLPALGIAYDDGFLFVAGAGPGITDNLNLTIAYVYNAESGDYVVACTADGNLWNDITIYDGTAYITDSRLNLLYTLDVNAAKQGECEVGAIDLPAAFFLAEGDAFLANGIDVFEAGLIIVTSATGLLFYHDLDAGTTIPISSIEESFPGGDGLLVDGERVYVTNNQNNQIIIYDLEISTEGFVAIVTAALVGTIESANFDSPATSALIERTLYSVNARFGTVPFPTDAEADLATFQEEFQIVATSIDAISV